MKNLRDYAVPIIAFLIILLIAYNALGGDGSQSDEKVLSETETSENIWAKMSINLWDDDTSGSIEYPGWNRDDLVWKEALYPGEKLVVEWWSVTLQDDSGILMKLNKNWELKYEDDWGYLLTSSDLFVKSEGPVNVNLRFLDTNLSAGAIVSLNQNEVASTVNVLAWEVNVKSIAGKSVTLTSWQRLNISSRETTQEDYDIEGKTEEIGNYFFSETWAQENDLEWYLKAANQVAEITGTGQTTGTWTNLAPSPDAYISINGLKDKQTYGTPTTDVSGELLKDGVAKISFNGIFASINLVWKSYELNGLSIPLRENDVIYKVYDAWDNILERGLYTVYYTEWAITPEEITTDTSTETEEFPVTDSNASFAFTAPAFNPYTSNENFITIRGSATAGSATSVQVNGLTLKSFNGTTWRYHASIDWWNLRNGVNLYKVNYFNAAWEVVHTNTFTIIRKIPVTSAAAAAQTTTNNNNTSTPVSGTNPEADSGWDTIGDRIPLD